MRLAQIQIVYHCFRRSSVIAFPIHELAHIKEKNHSKRFWDLVAQYIPDYKTRRKNLKQFGHILHAQYN